jgi:hypothetical protein
MNKGKVARLAGFVGALGVSTVLVTTAIQGTGAYFTDSHDGSVSGTSGTLKLAISGSTTLDWNNLEPTKYQDKEIKFAPTSATTLNEDVWLVFDSSTYAYGVFTGTNKVAPDVYNGWTDGGMGRYGHFAVAVNDATIFQSYNLQLPAGHESGVPGWTSTGANNTCTVTSSGHGGSAYQPSSTTDKPAECGVPSMIKLASNVKPHTGWNSLDITFGITGRATDQNPKAWASNVPFQIVATQVGVMPNAENY